VGHYLETERDDAPVRPVDSNANAGVSNVDGREGQVTGEGAQDDAAGYLAALRGPLPMLIFSLVAIGGIATILARSSRALARRRREPSE
jgi:Na+(H+)/acetate symporter ActP